VALNKDVAFPEAPCSGNGEHEEQGRKSETKTILFEQKDFIRHYGHGSKESRIENGKSIARGRGIWKRETEIGKVHEKKSDWVLLENEHDVVQRVSKTVAMRLGRYLTVAGV